MSRAGESTTLTGYVLSTTPISEKDKILQFYSREQGKISILARNAQRSVKRFGGCLEPLQRISVLTKFPRENSSTPEPLWFIQSANLEQSFFELRSSYQKLQSALFVSKFTKDIIPNGDIDDNLFESYQDYIASLNDSTYAACSSIGRFAFLAWFAKQYGYGNLSVALKGRIAKYPDTYKNAWREFLSQERTSFSKLFTAIAFYQDHPLNSLEEENIYAHWSELTGLEWKYYLQWLKNL